MRGLHVEHGEVRFRDDLPPPEPAAGLPGSGARSEVRVRVLRAGICATDLALVRGYMDFRGTPGHEFVGRALDGPLAGRRVVGEINAACGVCPRCRAGLARHCPRRTVLGILGRAGAFAEELVLPAENLHAVPDAVGDDAATFVEPLAAAFEIGEQVALADVERALVIGDGRLGLLCAQVLASAGPTVLVRGRHPERAALFGDRVRYEERPGDGYDLVVEATGDPRSLALALAAVRPRGTVVLKTTSEERAPLDLAPLVVDEITLVGSRCGPFAPALAALASGAVAVEPLVAARFPLERGPDALAEAARPGVLKVLLEP